MFAQTYHSVSVFETPVKDFSSSNLPFRQNQLVKFEISTLSPAGKKFISLFWAELKATIQFLPKLFKARQCHKMKLLCQFFAQAIYVLDKTNQ